MKIRRYTSADMNELVQLIIGFRNSLASLKSQETKCSPDDAKDELNSYISKGFPIYMAVDSEKIVGYIVCRIDSDVVWAESLYVIPEYRRTGVGSKLYLQAEELANEYGNETLFNWIHPNNETIVQFLKKQGYNVLNLIELRKPWSGEKPTRKIQVGKNEFDY